MTEKSRFFNSGVGDVRTYQAEDFAEYFGQILSNGILNGGTNLQVSTTGTNMQSHIAAGFAWIQGYMYKVEGSHALTHSTAHATLNRIDRVVVRLDRSAPNRHIRAFVLTGTPHASPQPPSLTRAGDIFEISLARVLVSAGLSTIAQGNVTDERLDTNVCGLANSLIRVDTTTMQAQWDAFMADLAGRSYVTENWATSRFVQMLAASSTFDQLAMASAIGLAGQVLGNIIGATFDPHRGLTTMTAVAANTTAMTAVAASTTAMTAVAASTTAMNIVAASSTARTVCRGSGTAMTAIGAVNMAIGKFAAGEAGLDPTLWADMTAVAASTTAMNIVAANTTAMNIVAANTTAMNIVAANTTAMNIVAANTTAMNIVAANTTAMTAVAASTTAMNIVVANTTAMNIVAASSTARTVCRGSGTAMTAIGAVNMAIGKFAAGEAGLDPTLWADMTAVAASTTAMNIVAANTTAMNIVAASSTARTVCRGSGTAMTAIGAVNMAIGKFAAGEAGLDPTLWADMTAIAANATAMNAVAASLTARTAIRLSATAITAINASQLALDRLYAAATLVTYPGGSWSADPAVVAGVGNYLIVRIRQITNVGAWNPGQTTPQYINTSGTTWTMTNGTSTATLLNQTSLPNTIDNAVRAVNIQNIQWRVLNSYEIAFLTA